MTHDFGYLSLDISAVTPKDSGVYSCKAINRQGEVSTSFPLKVQKATRSLAPSSTVATTSVPSLIGPEKQSMESPKFVKVFKPSVNAKEGESIHHEAKISPENLEDMEIRWLKDNMPLRADGRIKTIHDNGIVILEVCPVHRDDTGQYSVYISNPAGQAAATFKVDIESPDSLGIPKKTKRVKKVKKPKVLIPDEENRMEIDKIYQVPCITKPLADLDLPENGTARFECQFKPIIDEGEDSYEVNWLHKGKLYKPDARTKTIDQPGLAILEIGGIKPNDSGQFSCQIVTKSRQTVVSTCQLRVKASLVDIPMSSIDEAHIQRSKSLDAVQPPRFVTPLTDMPNKTEGESLHLECRLEPANDSSMKIEWFHNGLLLEPSSKIRTLNDFGFVVLEIDWLYPSDSGEFSCKATNKFGMDVTRASIRVKERIDEGLKKSDSGRSLKRSDSSRSLKKSKSGEIFQIPSLATAEEDEQLGQPPKFIVQLQNLSNLNEGESVHLECQLIPNDDADMRVDWYHNGKPLITGHRFKATHNFGFVALDILHVTPEDSGEYVAVAINDYGQDSTRTVFVCSPARQIYRPQFPKVKDSSSLTR